MLHQASEAFLTNLLVKIRYFSKEKAHKDKFLSTIENIITEGELTAALIWTRKKNDPT